MGMGTDSGALGVTGGCLAQVCADAGWEEHVNAWIQFMTVPAAVILTCIPKFTGTWDTDWHMMPVQLTSLFELPDSL